MFGAIICFFARLKYLYGKLKKLDSGFYGTMANRIKINRNVYEKRSSVPF